VNPNVLHFRAGLLALNLLGAVGVPAYAALSYWKTAEDAGVLAIADPLDLVFREGEAAIAERGLRELDAEAFHPRRPAEPPADLAPEEEGVPPSTLRPGELPTGPLAEAPHHLEYVFGIRREDPLRNFVILRRKEASGSAPEPTAARRLDGRPRRPVRVTATSPRAEQHPDDVSFFVADRWYWDPDRGLDFMIHSADEKELLYWMPDRPGQMYALRYVGRQGLEPAQKAGDDPLLQPARRPGIIPHLDNDFEKLREEEYQRMRTGGKRGPLLSPRRLP
jgi:hypothetical protein